jgi:hypothetical protein
MSTAKHFLQTVHFNYWDVNALIELAGKQGYRFTADELQAAADELWGQLSEEQLRSVVGGGGNGRQDPGPVDPSGNTPPGQLEDRSAGWSPRAGEVSGRSCFFIRGGNGNG